MKLRALVSAALLLASPAVVCAQPAHPSPGIWHSVFMRGSVVKASGPDVVLCVGKVDGAQAGQVFNVYRMKEHPHAPRGLPGFMRVDVGTVTISEVIDDHFARATVISGNVKKHDIVELRRPLG